MKQTKTICRRAGYIILLVLFCVIFESTIAVCIEQPVIGTTSKLDADIKEKVMTLCKKCERHFHAKRYNMAIECYNKALEIDHSAYKIYHNIALAQIKIGLKYEAEKNEGIYLSHIKQNSGLIYKNIKPAQSAAPAQQTMINIKLPLDQSLIAYVKADIKQNLEQYKYPEGLTITVIHTINFSTFSDDGNPPECSQCLRKVARADIIIEISNGKGPSTLRGKGENISYPGEVVSNELLARSALSQAINNAFGKTKTADVTVY